MRHETRPVKAETATGARRRAVRAGLALPLALLLAGCTTLGGGLEELANGAGTESSLVAPVRRDPVTFEAVQSNDPQSTIGKSQHPRILAAYGGAYSDPKLERMLAGIVGKLNAVSSDPGRAYSITVLNSPNINAFALPGGYLYVTRGLLALANDSAEVAAVLAHEMGHVKANHGIERQQREEAAELAGRVVTEVLASDTTAARAALARGRLNLASFSRNQELQADAMGIKQTGDAGYDPYAAARFLKAMDSFSSFRNAFQASNPNLDFLASHPAAPQRVDLARRHAAVFGPPGTGVTDRDRYLAGIDGMLFGDTASEGYVRARTFFHPGLGITFTVPEGFVIDNTAEAVLATGPGDTAIRFDGVALPATTSLTDYIQSGWVGGLDAATIRPFRIGDLEAVSAQAVGGSYVFNVTVIRAGSQVYRFLTALPADTAARLPRIAESIAGSFRMLRPEEREQLKPLRVRIVTARAGDTERSLADRIQGVDRKVEMFRLLNDLEDGSGIRTGERYKIIAE
ncbi:metalloprotease [Aureimonas flava]|uniref:Metalloprotease n=1 Tax=Aureimonas flava TaxID=2320271 RepID=A0A3A1WJW1_9HYPH|nr:M48 family metalloprotease [Aureimonas flava]RIY00169.1 metalloprotease [Aureimonas flava]